MSVKKFALILLSNAFLFSCSSFISDANNKDKSDSKPNIVGGACEYNKIKGKVTILSITPADAKEQNCSADSVVVQYKFTPSNPDDLKKYKFPDFSDTRTFLVSSSGKNPDKKWIEKFEVKVGNTYDATRDEITTGTCTPYMIMIPELEKTSSVFCE